MVKVCNPPSDTTNNHRSNRELRSVVLVVVENFELGGFVDTAPILWRCGGEQSYGLGEVVDDRSYLVFGHSSACGDSSQPDLGAFSFGLCSLDSLRETNDRFGVVAMVSNDWVCVGVDRIGCGCFSLR